MAEQQSSANDPMLETQDPLVLEAPRPVSETRAKRFRLWHWFLLLLALGFMAFAITRCVVRNDEQERMQVSGISPQGQKLTQVSAKTSEEYRHKLDVYSERKAKEALAEGGSFIQPTAQVHAPDRQSIEPIPVAQKQEDSAAQKAVEVVAPKPLEPKPLARPFMQERRQVKQSQGNAAMVQFLQGVEVVMPKPQTMLLNTPASRYTQALPGAQPQGSEVGIPGFKAGDILYAINRITLDSDAPGPAMVEVMQGSLRGAKAIGSFQRLGEHLVLKFNELILVNGVSYAIQGYAIDPQTDRTAVRTSVDTHMLRRWGGLIAASFLDGFGDAVSRSGSASYNSVYGSSWNYPDYNLNQELWIGAGKVGERAAGIMEKRFSQAPTVVLQSGTVMGVLLLRVGSAKESVVPRQARSSDQEATQTLSEIKAEQESVRSRQNSQENTTALPYASVPRSTLGRLQP